MNFTTNTTDAFNNTNSTGNGTALGGKSTKSGFGGDLSIVFNESTAIGALIVVSVVFLGIVGRYAWICYQTKKANEVYWQRVQHVKAVSERVASARTARKAVATNWRNPLEKDVSGSLASAGTSQEELDIEPVSDGAKPRWQMSFLVAPTLTRTAISSAARRIDSTERQRTFVRAMRKTMTANKMPRFMLTTVGNANQAAAVESIVAGMTSPGVVVNPLAAAQGKGQGRGGSNGSGRSNASSTSAGSGSGSGSSSNSGSARGPAAGTGIAGSAYASGPGRPVLQPMDSVGEEAEGDGDEEGDEQYGEGESGGDGPGGGGTAEDGEEEGDEDVVVVLRDSRQGRGGGSGRGQGDPHSARSADSSGGGGGGGGGSGRFTGHSRLHLGIDSPAHGAGRGGGGGSSRSAGSGSGPGAVSSGPGRGGGGGHGSAAGSGRSLSAIGSGGRGGSAAAAAAAAAEEHDHDQDQDGFEASSEEAVPEGWDWRYAEDGVTVVWIGPDGVETTDDPRE